MKNSETENVLFTEKKYIGIEFGSTRIKAVLINQKHQILAQGSHVWENQLIDGIWTYSLQDVVKGLQNSYHELKMNVIDKYGIVLKNVDSLGISGMMHGYLVFNKQLDLLTPFRSWRNTMTQNASDMLTSLFDFHIPQRWSIAHLYQAILNNESHVRDISMQTTLAGYVHYLLTGQHVLGIGDASGMFPIDINTCNYDANMMNKFENLINDYSMTWSLRDILPKVLNAGDDAGVLSMEGARLLDPEGDLMQGIPLCPPEGDAGTGMVATNSIQPCSGNVSVGTSVFAMIVLNKALKKAYEAIDIVTTPEGNPVAMVHCNNGTSELNAWVTLFQEVLHMMGMHAEISELYAKLFYESMKADSNGGGLLSCNYLSGEHITNFEAGIPLILRQPQGKLTLANFMRTQMYSSLSTLKIGMDILIKEEQVNIEHIFGHGGFFKTPEISQKIMAAALHTPISVMETAGEGGAWGCAVLAAYRANCKHHDNLTDYLNSKVFSDIKNQTVQADAELQQGFEEYIEDFKHCLNVERYAVEELSAYKI